MTGHFVRALTFFLFLLASHNAFARARTGAGAALVASPGKDGFYSVECGSKIDQAKLALAKKFGMGEQGRAACWKNGGSTLTCKESQSKSVNVQANFNFACFMVGQDSFCKGELTIFGKGTRNNAVIESRKLGSKMIGILKATYGKPSSEDHQDKEGSTSDGPAHDTKYTWSTDGVEVKAVDSDFVDRFDSMNKEHHRFHLDYVCKKVPQPVELPRGRGHARPSPDASPTSGTEDQ